MNHRADKSNTWVNFFMCAQQTLLINIDSPNEFASVLVQTWTILKKYLPIQQSLSLPWTEKFSDLRDRSLFIGITGSGKIWPSGVDMCSFMLFTFKLGKQWPTYQGDRISRKFLQWCCLYMSNSIPIKLGQSTCKLYEDSKAGKSTVAGQ